MLKSYLSIYSFIISIIFLLSKAYYFTEITNDGILQNISANFSLDNHTTKISSFYFSNTVSNIPYFFYSKFYFDLFVKTCIYLGILF